MNLRLSCVFLGLIISYFAPLTVYCQYIDLDTFEFRAILAEDETMFIHDLTKRGDPIICTKPKQSQLESVSVLRPALFDEKGGCPLEPFANYAIYKNNIFAISFDNSISPGWEFNEELLDIGSNYREYFFIINNDKNSHYKKEAQKAYVFHQHKLLLENYRDVATRKKSTFNYDFIIENDEIYLIVLLESELYIFQASDVNNLTKTSWITKACIQAPFRQEYFLICKDEDGSYTFHTKSQGEYQFIDFKKTPKILKINDEPLGDKIFIDDKKTGKVHQLTRKEFNKIKSSIDHTKALEKFLKNK